MSYVDRSAVMNNLALTDSQLADLAFQGLITPIKEKFSAQDFDSLAHLAQKEEDDDPEVAAAEWARNKRVVTCQWVKGSRKDEKYDFDITKADKIFDLLLREKQIQLPAGHVIPSVEALGKRKYCKWHNSGSHATNDCKVFRQQIQSAIESGKIKFDDLKRPMKVDGNPFPINMVHTPGRIADGGNHRSSRLNLTKIINKYQRRYEKQQEKYAEDNGCFDPHWDCEFFRFCWNEGMRLPSIEDCPGCSDSGKDSAGSLSRSYNRENQPRQKKLPVHQRLGPIHQDYFQDEDDDKSAQWCPSGIFTKNQKRRVQRLRNRERFQEVQQEINHRLKKRRQEWRVKSKVLAADEVEADKARRLAKGKAAASSSVNMVFVLPAEYEANQADADVVEESSAKLILSPEQAVFEKPEGAENRHLKPLYVKGFVNGWPMSKMMVDGGAAVNLMPYATFRKLGKNATDLIKTNMALKDFGGNPSETNGVLNSLIQWQGDKIEIVATDSQLETESPNYFFEGVVEGSNFYTKDTMDDLNGKLGQGFMSADDLEEVDIVPLIKNNGKLRVCVDFRNLNKATPKDEYPMPIADQLVDAASGHKIISFMDGNAGYNQIFMAEEDIHKTTFRCSSAIGLYEWVVMTFGLKSAGATYQRAMNYIFHDLIGSLAEIYNYDVVVKSPEIIDHIADLRKVYERTRKYGLKMNPTKCDFGVLAGQFLGFLVHERGIEITQRSINAIHKIQPPEDKKQLLSLIGKYMLSAQVLKGRVGNWIYALTEFDLRYESPKAVKGQAIADFIVEHRDSSVGSVDIVPWSLFFDGSVCTHGCGIGLVIISPRGACFEFAYTIKPYVTNNQAEYEAVLKGLQLLKEVEADAVEIMGDSLLVISQLAGEYECKNDTLVVYNEKCRKLMNSFRLVTLQHVCREQNMEANDLAQGESSYKPMAKDMQIEVATIMADDWMYDVL
uniref:Retrotransposon protein, putative, unclassified n=2 Tax=Oryza sativa subsp. japonica TaxID=39947 RepID=Q10GE6_ORYSJ|nr:retrotransposon protein, putative, unclassified [Oryza sativa Japonica Group]ABF97756.1 retrotransposon protein, putative, unclassified [Oryza sativa Japonica Group]